MLHYESEEEGKKMADTNTPSASKSFKDVCLVENNPTGNGIQITAFGSNGKPIATGDAVRKEGVVWDTFLDNMRDLLSTGGKATADSHTLDNGKNAASYKDGGIKLDVAAGSCEVTTVDGGQNADKPKQLGIVLKDVPFTTAAPAMTR